jgi:universal stress protein A
MATPDWVLNEEELVKNAEQSLKTLQQEHGIPDAERLVLSGSPKHEIVRFAEEQNVDLIVIGSHGRHGIGRLLGSTAYPVLHHASCDVLAVRIKEQ